VNIFKDVLNKAIETRVSYPFKNGSFGRKANHNNSGFSLLFKYCKNKFHKFPKPIQIRSQIQKVVIFQLKNSTIRMYLYD